MQKSKHFGAVFGTFSVIETKISLDLTVVVTTPHRSPIQYQLHNLAHFLLQKGSLVTMRIYFANSFTEFPSIPFRRGTLSHKHMPKHRHKHLEVR